jgi:hypothetical protein
MANKEKQQEYYKLAADWVDWFLETQPNLKNIKAYHGIIFLDVHYTLDYDKYRMQHNVGAERVCAYTRIRNFKQWYLNVYQNG